MCPLITIVSNYVSEINDLIKNYYKLDEEIKGTLKENLSLLEEKIKELINGQELNKTDLKLNAITINKVLKQGIYIKDKNSRDCGK